MSGLSRRGFLASIGALGVGALVGCTQADLADEEPGERDVADDGDELVDRLAELTDTAAVAPLAAVAAAQLGTSGVGAAEALVPDDTAAAQAWRTSGGQGLADLVAGAVTEDLTAGRLQVVDGWVLTRTEALVAAALA